MLQHAGGMLNLLRIFSHLQLAKIRDWGNAYIQHTHLTFPKPGAAEQSDDLHSLCPKSTETRELPEHVVMKGSFFRNSKFCLIFKAFAGTILLSCEMFFQPLTTGMWKNGSWQSCLELCVLMWLCLWIQFSHWRTLLHPWEPVQQHCWGMWYRKAPVTATAISNKQQPTCPFLTADKRE